MSLARHRSEQDSGYARPSHRIHCETLEYSSNHSRPKNYRQRSSESCLVKRSNIASLGNLSCFDQYHNYRTSYVAITAASSALPCTANRSPVSASYQPTFKTYCPAAKFPCTFKV